MTLDLATLVEQERAIYEQRHVPATLVTIDGVTREQAYENYMQALAQLVVYLCTGLVFELLGRPDWAAYTWSRCHAPTPEGWQAVVGFQCAEHMRANPPRLRTIELVSG